MARKTVSAPPPEPEFTNEELEVLGESQNSPTLGQDDMEDMRPDDEDYESDGDSDKEPTGEEEQQQQTDQPERVKMVNHGALHKERAIRKEIQVERDQMRERNTLLEQRLNLILQKLATEEEPVQKETPPPDPEVDPIGYIKWQSEKIAQLESGQKQRTQRETEHSQMQAHLQRGTALAMEVRQKDPEKYDAAINFVTESRARQLQALGMDNAQVQQTVQQEMVRGMLYALSKNQNPGDFMMKFAEASGFVHQKKTDEGDPNAIDRVAARMSSNKTLGNSPKHGSTGKLTPTDIAEMSDDDFEKFYNKIGKKGFASAFGP